MAVVLVVLGAVGCVAARRATWRAAWFFATGAAVAFVVGPDWLGAASYAGPYWWAAPFFALAAILASAAALARFGRRAG